MVPPLMETYAATLRAPSLTLQYGSGVGRIHTGEGSPSARQSAIHPRSSSYLFRSAGVARRSITERTKDCVYRTHDTVDTTSCETSPRHLGGEDSAARIPRRGFRGKVCGLFLYTGVTGRMSATGQMLATVKKGRSSGCMCAIARIRLRTVLAIRRPRVQWSSTGPVGVYRSLSLCLLA